MKKILQSPARIKFSDCDPMGHLYNANHIRYLLNAREDQIEAALNFNPIDHVRDTGEGWMIVQNQISYFRPGMFNETVICDSFIRGFTSKMLEIECKMWDKSMQAVKSLLWTRFIYTNAQAHRAATHPDYIMKMFEELVNPIPEKTFEERVKHFRQLNKSATVNQSQ